MKFGRIIAIFICAVIILTMPVSAAQVEDYFIEDFSDEYRICDHLIYSEGFAYSQDGGLVGGADATIITSNPEESGFYTPVGIYRAYDSTVTLTAVDDPDSENERFLNLVYRNYNLWIAGITKEEIDMCFTYDFQNMCFRFTEGWSNTDEADQLMPPVYMELCDDGTAYYTLGMTVERDRIRCFFNDELIFDYIDAERKYLIADETQTPFIFVQKGNYVHITNVSVDRPGYLLEPSYAFGDANSDGRVNLSDVSLIMKHIAKWTGLDINKDAADISRDRKIRLEDAARIIKWIAAGKTAK